MIDSYNIPWPNCYCPECTRYHWDENYKKSIDDENRRKFESCMEMVHELVTKIKKNKL